MMPTAREFADEFFQRHPKLRRYAPSKVLDKTYGGSSGHGEARQHGSEIWLFPKFWALPADVQDFVFAHEIGHYVLSEYGLSKFSREAEAAGVDVWDNLPFGQFNQDEAFAEVFATYFLTPSELRSRYPEWVPIVEGVAKTADMNPKPPSKSQIDYAKRLLQQVGADEPDWDRLDGVEVSTLIDALKKKRGKPVWYSNGQFSHWEKESGIRVVLATRGMSWEKASGTKVVIATGGMSWGHARMMLRVAARYKEKKTVKTQEGKERTVYVYSERQIALRNAEKARKVEKIKSSIGKLRSKLKKDIRSEDPEKKLTALAVALMDHTYERVGNDESAAERGHFGVTGWQKKHISFGKGGVSISYTGKSGVKHKKTVSDDTIKKALRDAYEAVEDDDACLFSWEGGKVTAEKVNAYLEPFGVTAKDIRGYHANDQMASKLREARKAGGELPTDKKEKTKLLKAEFKKALEETAEAVGHEAATLRSQYLIPGIEEQYTKSGTILDKVASALIEAEDARWMMAHSVIFRYLSSV
jgi:DNA topoisomerase IB